MKRKEYGLATPLTKKKLLIPNFIPTGEIWIETSEASKKEVAEFMKLDNAIEGLAMVRWKFKCSKCGYDFRASTPRRMYENEIKCDYCGSTEFIKKLIGG
jgi:DNA-directed RNA polymerase subunit RPC12/RpoP